MFKIGDCVVLNYMLYNYHTGIPITRGYIEEIKLSRSPSREFVVLWEDGFKETWEQVHLLLV